MKSHLQPQSTSLTPKEAAAYLRLGERTLERMRIDGTGPRFWKSTATKKGRVFYRLQDLDTWLAARGFASTTEYQAQNPPWRR